ncbi:MAG: FtsX-like permease family protein [Ruthenibacterium sp.]
MKKTYRKNIRRTIWQSVSRFGAIFAIVALGVGFLAGLLATTPDMCYSGDRYFDETNLFDMRVMSSMGVTDDDVAALRDLPCVKEVMPAYSADMLVKTSNGDTLVTRIHSLPLREKGQSAPENYINRVDLIEGRLPLKPNECAAESGSAYAGGNLKLGDTLYISDENESVEDSFSQRAYEVVGIVKSSYYFSYEREPASVGNGTTALVMYVNADAFSMDVYTDAFISVEGAAQLNSLSDAYVDLTDDATKQIEAISDLRCEKRLAEIRIDAQTEIDDANEKYEDAKAEATQKLADAARKLLDGKNEVADGEAELTDAQKKIADGQNTLEKERTDLPDNLLDAQKQLEAGQGVIDVSKAQLAAGLAQYNQQKQAYDAGVAQIESAKAGVAQLEPLVAQSEAALPQLTQQLAQVQAYYDQANAAYTAAVEGAHLNDLQAAYDAAQNAVSAAIAAGGYADEAAWAAADPAAPALLAQREGAKQMLDGATAQLAAAKAALDTVGAQLAQVRTGFEQASMLAGKRAELEAAKAQIAATEPQLAASAPQLAAAAAQLESARLQIISGEAQLANGATALQKAPAEAEKEFAKAEKELRNARNSYNEGLITLADAREKLADGQAEYDDAKAKADKELADAAAELADAQQAVDDLALPEWYVLDRESNVSFASFHSNTQKVEAIAKVFPIFFFLVAALVALTTMTRMVEEERLQIGTMKALGYKKSAIMSKYIFYAMAATILGCIFGLTVGFKLFPTVIWNAYTMMYTLPKLYCQFNVPYAVFASAAAILCTLAATLSACNATLAECPAQLMLPRAPKAGKRILLERITPIWKRMKFTHKVTARNLFRYKKRFFMTVIGIAGCTALLVTGFGLHDSISDIVNKQFGDVFTYDLIVALKDAENLQDDDLQTLLNDKSLVDDFMPVHQEKSTNTYGDNSFATYLFVPQDNARLTDFVSLQKRVNNEAVPFTADGVVITEKMAERTGYGIGDMILLENNDHQKAEFRISGVVENYVENYVYMSADLYKTGYGKAPDFSMIVARAHDNAKEGRDLLSTALLKIDNIAAVNFTADIKDSFTNMMQKIDTIVVVLIVSAGLLAFVVLYNLTNINITERIKEIATIKVLGFYDKEVSAYVYRESIVLSIIGTLCGLILGVFLHMFVIYNIEVDAVMFGRTIQPLSYVFSAVLTLVFSMLVNLVMKRKLRKISMVESMKAPE